MPQDPVLPSKAFVVLVSEDDCPSDPLSIRLASEDDNASEEGIESFAERVGFSAVADRQFEVRLSSDSRLLQTKGGGSLCFVNPECRTGTSDVCVSRLGKAVWKGPLPKTNSSDFVCERVESGQCNVHVSGFNLTFFDYTSSARLVASSPSCGVR